MHWTELNINFNIQELDQINSLVKRLINLMDKGDEEYVQVFIEDTARKEVIKYWVADYNKRFANRETVEYYQDFNSFQARVSLTLAKVLVHYNDAYLS